MLDIENSKYHKDIMFEGYIPHLQMENVVDPFAVSVMRKSVMYMCLKILFICLCLQNRPVRRDFKRGVLV